MQQRQQHLMVDYDAIVGVQRTVQIAGMGWLCNGVGGSIPPTLTAAKLLSPSGPSVVKSYTTVRFGSVFLFEGLAVSGPGL